MKGALKRYEYIPLEFWASRSEPVPDFLTQPIVTADLAKLYFLSRGRNAWNSTWVHQYSTSAVFERFSGAKLAAEKQRTQGTVFYIEDVLSVIMTTKNFSMAVLEINSFRELARLSDIPLRLLTLNEIAAHFSNALSNSVALFWVTSRNLEAASLPFERRTSVATGGKSSLGWRFAKGYAVDFEPATKVVDRVKQGITGLPRPL